MAGLVEVLHRRYGDYDQLALFLDLECDRRLADIAAPGPLPIVAHAVVVTAERDGWVDALRAALARAWPDDPGLAVAPAGSTLDPVATGVVVQRASPGLVPPEPVLPALPAAFVPRPAEHARLLAALRDVARRDVAARPVAVAVYGTGGFGKTTLVLAVCRDREVTALFPDGIVFVEVGQQPVLTAVLADLTARVTGDAPARYGTVDAASAALAEALADRRVLLVLDNVWRSADLEPLLRGGPRAVRLVTSRRSDVLPAGAALVPVERMSAEEAVALLLQDLPGATAEDVAPLYERSHRWPVVLGILNGVLRSRTRRMSAQPLAELVDDLVRRLDRFGLTGADDVADPEVRTVRDVLGVGVDELGRQGAALRERYLSLAAFPPDRQVPFAVLERLWGCDALEARTVCDRFADRSLLAATSHTGVALHDVVRDQLLPGYSDEVRSWAGRLLAVLRALRPAGGWHAPPLIPIDDLDWLAYLLVSTDDAATLRALLLDLRFVARRVVQGGTSGLLADIAESTAASGDSAPLTALARTVALEGHLALRVEGVCSVAATLYARTVGEPDLFQVLTDVDEALVGALRAVSVMPDRPDPRLLRVLAGDGDRVLDVCWRPDGRRLAAGYADGLLRVWDDGGRLLRSVVLPAAVNAVAWSPDGLYLAALVGTSSVVRVEPVLGEQVEPALEPGDELTAIVWSPAGAAALAVGRADGAVLEWDGVGAPEVVVGGGGPVVRALAWTAETGLVALHGDGTLTRPARAGAVRTSVRTPRALAAQPGTARVAVGGTRYGLELVDLDDPPRTVAVSPATGWITSAGWSADGTWLAAGLQDGAVALWSTGPLGVVDVRRWTPERVRWAELLGGRPALDHHGMRVAALRWHPVGSALAVAAHIDVRVFDPSVPPAAAAAPVRVSALTWDPARHVVAGTADGRILVVPPSDGWFDVADARSRPAHDGEVRVLRWAPGGALVSAGADGVVLRWDAAGPVELGRVDGGVTALAAGPGGAVAACRGGIVLLDHAGGVRTCLETDGEVNDLALDPSGAQLAVATSGSTVVVHRLDDGADVRLDGHLSSVRVVRWVAPDRLVSGGLDGQVLLWDTVGRRVLDRLDPGGGAVFALDVVGDVVVSATTTGLLRLYHLSGGERCTVALDAGLALCALTPEGRGVVVSGPAGLAVFEVPRGTAPAQPPAAGPDPDSTGRIGRRVLQQ